MTSKLINKSPTENRSVVVFLLRHPYALIGLGCLFFFVLNLNNDSARLAGHQIEWHDIIAQSLIALVAVLWIHSVQIAHPRAATRLSIFGGCACLIWLMTVKLLQELFEEQTQLLTFFELGLSVFALGFISFGWVLWTRDFKQTIGQLRSTTKAYRTLSETDPLTGLLNRGQFESTVNELLKSEVQFTLVLVDIDLFKNVNDEYGHPAGDMIIKSVGQQMMAFHRSTDYAFRIGGEEFALIFVNCPKARTLERSEDMRKSIEERVFTSEDDQTIRVTISVGMSHTFSGDTYADVYRRADSALYTAKQKGRNQVSYYQE